MITAPPQTFHEAAAPFTLSVHQFALILFQQAFLFKTNAHKFLKFHIRYGPRNLNADLASVTPSQPGQS